jgi:uncharacterized protein YceK
VIRLRGWIAVALMVGGTLMILAGCGTCLERTPDGRGITVCGGLS